MATIQANMDRQELCRQLAEVPEAAQRAEVITRLRGLIAEERKSLQTPANKSYLRVAEMVLDFLEEAPPSRDRGPRQ